MIGALSLTKRLTLLPKIYPISILKSVGAVMLMKSRIHDFGCSMQITDLSKVTSLFIKWIICHSSLLSTPFQGI